MSVGEELTSVLGTLPAVCDSSQKLVVYLASVVVDNVYQKSVISVVRHSTAADYCDCVAAL